MYIKIILLCSWQKYLQCIIFTFLDMGFFKMALENLFYWILVKITILNLKTIKKSMRKLLKFIFSYMLCLVFMVDELIKIGPSLISPAFVIWHFLIFLKHFYWKVAFCKLLFCFIQNLTTKFENCYARSYNIEVEQGSATYILFCVKNNDCCLM